VIDEGANADAAQMALSLPSGLTRPMEHGLAHREPSDPGRRVSSATPQVGAFDSRWHDDRRRHAVAHRQRHTEQQPTDTKGCGSTGTRVTACAFCIAPVTVAAPPLGISSGERECLHTALISSPKWVVFDAADRGFGLRRGRVISSASPTRLAPILLCLPPFRRLRHQPQRASTTCPQHRPAGQRLATSTRSR
jgi:hypothetical protein